jgi:hypothetical protein
VSDLPPSFDPQYVQGIIHAADAIDPQKAESSAPNIQKEVDYYRGIGRPELADRLLQRHAEGGPIVANNGDGTFTIVPHNMIGGGAPPSQPQAGGPRQISSKAEYDALPPGSQYVAPDGTTRTKGGAGPQAPQTFR